MANRRKFGYVRKLPSGKYQASYVGPDEKRYTGDTTFRTKSRATDWLTTINASILEKRWESTNQEPEVAEPNGVIFSQYAHRHIEIQTNHKGELLRASTKALYERLLKTKLGCFLDRPINEIKSAQVSEWWAQAIENGHRTSASKAYKLLSAVMKRAVDEELIVTNPCKVKGAQSATSNKKLVVPSPDEVSTIAAAINTRYTMMVITMAYGGFRFGEVTELRVKDFSKVQRETADGNVVEAYEIRVERAVTLVKGKFVVDKPKSSASEREVPVSSLLTEKIDALLGSRPKDPESLVFPAATGGHQRHDVFINSWNPALKRCGLGKSGITPHALRHFAGTHLAKANANLAELKAWLGDSTTNAVMRYIHPTDRTPSLVEAMGHLK
jgi:integrase